MNQLAPETLNSDPSNVTQKTAWQVYLFKLGQVWPPLFLTWHIRASWHRLWQSEHRWQLWQQRRLIALVTTNGLLLIGATWGGLTCGFTGCGVAPSPTIPAITGLGHLNPLLDQASPAEQALIQQSQQAAAQAAQLAQNADGTQTNWLQRQNFLQQAIAPLLEIPVSSSLYGFAQDQKRTYQQQLTTIAINLDQEQTAQNSLTQAIAVIERAKTASLRAQTPTDFNQALGQWQGALTQLAQIPRQTSVYALAQQRLKFSEREFKTVKANQTPLVQADYDYRSALKFSQTAATAMENAQWEASVEAWQQAIAALEKIPANSNFAPKAQYLAPHYRSALQQGEQYLERVAQQQQVNANLQKLCLSAEKPCQFKINHQGIEVKLSQGYLQDLWDACLLYTSPSPRD